MLAGVSELRLEPLTRSLVQQFSGATVIRGYVVKIFGAVFHPANSTAAFVCPGSGGLAAHPAYLAAILLGLVRLTSSLAITWLLVLYRRRTMYLASAAATVLSLAVFATILLLGDHLAAWHTGLSQATLSWLSLAAACSLVFSVNLGVQPMPLLMSSELYPADIRAFCKVQC